MLNEIGRVCVKIAGRDAGKKCVIVDVLDNTYVMIDGETRRRKCNIMHLEPLNEKVEIDKGADHAEVAKVLKKLGIEVKETKQKEKVEKPKKTRTTKSEEKKEAKKEKSKEKDTKKKDKKAKK